MKRDRQLLEAGYHFTGEYAQFCDGKEKMKAKAAAWRKQGFRAVVLTESCGGGYSVYRKVKE